MEMPGRRRSERARGAGWRATMRRLLRDTRAATAVEFAIIAAPFLALIGAIMEMAVVFLASQVLDSATADAARLIRTGQAQQQSMNASQFKAQVCDRLYVLFDCNKVYVESTVYSQFSSIGNLNTYSAFKDADGNFDPTKVGSYHTGNGSDIVVVRVFYAYPVIFKNLGLDLANTADGKLLMTGVAVFRNEPFPWSSPYP